MRHLTTGRTSPADIAAAILVSILAAGCTATGGEAPRPPAGTATSAAADPSSPVAVALPDSSTTAASRHGTATTDAPAQVTLLQNYEPVAPAPEAAYPATLAPATLAPVTLAPVTPERLLDLDGPAVAQLLGPASLVRRDGPAEVWLYRSAGCTVDLFLYRRDGGALAVRHVEVREGRVQAAAPATCVAALARRHAGKGSG